MRSKDKLTDKHLLHLYNDILQIVDDCFLLDIILHRYGAHMEDMVVNGLDRQPMDFISAKVLQLTFHENSTWMKTAIIKNKS